MKKIRLLIDADFIIFQATEGKTTQGKFFGAEKGDVESDDYKEPLKKYKKKFNRIVQEIEDDVAVALLGEYKLKGKPKLAFSDPDTNFRYDIYEGYKDGRTQERSKLFYRLRAWALKKYGYVKNAEADDQCGYYGGEKYCICSMDKDVLKAIPGLHFDVYHTRRHIVRTGVLEAQNFTLVQTLMGDVVDGIKGIPRVGEKTAIKLLDEFGWNMDGVIKAYESKGLTKEDAILNRRLVGMDQLKKKGKKWKIQMWEQPKQSK